MIYYDDKQPINTLLNVDNIFGEYEGRVGPIILFLAIASAPLLLWIFILIYFIPFVWFIGPWLLWTGRWALYILGKEKQKMARWYSQRKDEYHTIDELVHVSFIHDDGLIEYTNGQVGYILFGLPKQTISDAKLSVDYERFMDELDHWDYDLYFHQVIGEINLTDNLGKLKRYDDNEVISERIEFYNYQDEYSSLHSGLYRYIFLVRAPKTNWKRLRQHLDSLVDSEVAKCFVELSIANKVEVNDIINRDICGFVDLQKMLVSKYDNSQFNNSKVLWFDDEVPEKLLPKKHKENLAERRPSYYDS